MVVDITVITVNINIYATAVVSIVNLNDRLRKTLLLTNISKDEPNIPAKNPLTKFISK
jgi:hypothetical protein